MINETEIDLSFHCIVLLPLLSFWLYINCKSIFPMLLYKTIISLDSGSVNIKERYYADALSIMSETSLLIKIHICVISQHRKDEGNIGSWTIIAKNIYFQKQIYKPMSKLQFKDKVETWNWHMGLNTWDFIREVRPGTWKGAYKHLIFSLLQRQRV